MYQSYAISIASASAMFIYQRGENSWGVSVWTAEYFGLHPIGTFGDMSVFGGVGDYAIQYHPVWGLDLDYENAYEPISKWLGSPHLSAMEKAIWKWNNPTYQGNPSWPPQSYPPVIGG